MILTFINYLVGSILYLIIGVFGLIDFIIPNEIVNAITWFFGHAKYLNGILPMSDILGAFWTYILFVVGLYSARLILTILSIMPIIGPRIDPNIIPRPNVFFVKSESHTVQYVPKAKQAFQIGGRTK